MSFNKHGIFELIVIELIVIKLVVDHNICAACSGFEIENDFDIDACNLLICQLVGGLTRVNLHCRNLLEAQRGGGG